MKRLCVLVSLILLVSCQQDELWEEPVRAELACETRGYGAMAPEITLVASAGNIGSLKVGGKLVNSFTINNMEDAFMCLLYRRPANPTDGRLNQIVKELAFFNVDHIKPTHYYVRITPRSLNELRRLEEDGTLVMHPFPYDCEIIGHGTIPHPWPEIDFETGELLLKAPISEQYAVIPVNRRLPAGTRYEILEKMFIPNLVDDKLAAAAGTKVISSTFSDLLIDQAMYLAGVRTVEEIMGEQKWSPAGCIKVYDELAGRYVGVPHIKVHAYNHYCDDWAYTDEGGNFKLDIGFKGPVGYYIEWSNPEYKILNSAAELAYYYCGWNTNGNLNLNIRNGEARGIASVARALAIHYYGDNPWGRIAESKRFPVYYRHEADNDESHKLRQAGFFSSYPEPHAVVYGLSHITQGEVPSAGLLDITFHELAHAFMYFECPDFYSFDPIIMESWARCVQCYMYKPTYQKLGYEFLTWTYDYGAGLSATYDEDNYHNLQIMDQEMYRTGGDDGRWDRYTPLFIDFIDDSNQDYFHHLYDRKNMEIYPNDNIVITDYKLLRDIVFASHNLVEFKTNAIKNVIGLGTTKKAIDEYMQFYIE